MFVFCSSVLSYGLRLLIHYAQCLEYDHCGKGAVFLEVGEGELTHTSSPMLPLHETDRVVVSYTIIIFNC